MKENKEWLEGFEYCIYSTRLLNKILQKNQESTIKKKIDILEVQKAIYYARKYHGDQKRQSGEPYYSHPLEVAYMLAEYTTGENKQYFRTDLLVSSILHDTIEDTELTQAMIAEIFGETVAGQVEALTRIKTHGKITSEELVNALLLQNNKDVLLIKMFDRLHNVQTLQAKSPEKIKEIMDETIRVFLFLSVYLEMAEITNILVRFCYEHLHIKEDINLVFAANNFQLPSLISRNDVDPVNNLQ